MRRSIAVVALSLVIAAFMATSAFATRVPNQPPGQPSQDCELLGVDHAGFDTGGFIHAQDVYADPSVLPPTANPDHTVSQYDVACFQQSVH
jgi:hypothetical protein